MPAVSWPFGLGHQPSTSGGGLRCRRQPPPATASANASMARADELGEFGRFGECGGMPPRPPVLAILAVLACARAHQKLARAFAVSTASSMTAAHASAVTCSSMYCE